MLSFRYFKPLGALLMLAAGALSTKGAEREVALGCEDGEGGNWRVGGFIADKDR